MAYDALSPANGLLIVDIPSAIRVKGEDVKGLVDTHVADTTSAHSASSISNVSTATISSTTVQDAINELDSEKMPLNFLDTSASLAANSDSKVPSQKAVKAFVESMAVGLQNAEADFGEAGHLAIPVITGETFYLFWGSLLYTGDLAAGNTSFTTTFNGRTFPHACVFASAFLGANMVPSTVIVGMESWTNTQFTVIMREFTSFQQVEFKINYIAIGY